MADNAIQKRSPQTLEEIIADKRDAFAKVATEYLDADRLVKLAQVMVSRTPDLRKCTPLSVIAELMTCSRLGLEPSVEGGRWLVPFKVKRDDGAVIYEVVGITDYRGLIDVARRSGEVHAIHADLRRAKDRWEYRIDSGGPTLVHLVHERAEGDRGEILGAYAIVKLANGQVQAASLSLEEVNAFKARSRSAESSVSPWNRDFSAMAQKTAIRRLYNLLPKTPWISKVREALQEEDERDRTDLLPPAVEAPALPAAPLAALKETLRRRSAAKVKPQEQDRGPTQEAAEGPDDGPPPGEGEEEGREPGQD